jgi:hypothetical protein
MKLKDITVEFVKRYSGGGTLQGQRRLIIDKLSKKKDDSYYGKLIAELRRMMRDK